MANYTPITNFALKDTLPAGDANKKAKGSDIQAELNAIAAAIQTKGDNNGGTFTGDVSFENIIASNIDCGTY